MRQSMGVGAGKLGLSKRGEYLKVATFIRKLMILVKHWNCVAPCFQTNPAETQDFISQRWGAFASSQHYQMGLSINGKPPKTMLPCGLSMFIIKFHHVSLVECGYIQCVRSNSSQRLFAQGAIYRSCQLPMDRGLGMGRRFSRPLWSLGSKLGRFLWFLGVPGSQELPLSTPGMLTAAGLNECRDWTGYIPRCLISWRLSKKKCLWMIEHDQWLKPKAAVYVQGMLKFEVQHQVVAVSHDVLYSCRFCILMGW